MKRIFVTIVMMLMLATSFAQIPQTFSYQAIVRDSECKLVVQKQVNVIVQILQGSDEGTMVYSERHNVTTNQNGLMTFELGGGEGEGSFSDIDWSLAPYFVRTEIEFEGNKVDAVTPLLSVPYALYAAKAGEVDIDLSDYVKKSELTEAVDLNDYYPKSEIDNKLAELNSQILKLRLQTEQGVIKSVFTVSAGHQICFSKGNLQYSASMDSWRFAENQWDYVGTQTPDVQGFYGGTVSGSDNSKISATYDGWIDLFGWGTSGWDEGAKAHEPYSISTVNSDYELDDKTNPNLDWGVYNKISNGGNAAGIWRTLTEFEWRFIVSYRPNAKQLCSRGQVNGVNGLILLPDNWVTPSSIQFTPHGEGWTTNSYSISEWDVMQSNGAVFLPAAGFRNGVPVHMVNTHGEYWTSSADSRDLSYGFEVYEKSMYTFSTNRCNGYAVRLVQDLK